MATGEQVVGTGHHFQPVAAEEGEAGAAHRAKQPAGCTRQLSSVAQEIWSVSRDAPALETTMV